MRFDQLKRTLMNAADAGSGNGAAPVPSATDNVPQAQGDTVTLSQAELDAKIAAAADKAVAAAKDSIFAEARRTFAGSKKDKTKDADTAPSQTPATPQFDAAKLRSLDRALTKNGWADRLSDAQYKRVEKAFTEDAPEDAALWVKDYFDGLGASPQPATQPATQAAPAQKPATEHSVTNRGAPPTAQVPLEEADLVTMSESDRKHWISQKGMRAYVQQLQKQLKGRSVSIRR